MRTYKITGRPLTHNGRRLSVGSKLRLDDADAAVLVERGRLVDGGEEPAPAKAPATAARASKDNGRAAAPK